MFSIVSSSLVFQFSSISLFPTNSSPFKVYIKVWFKDPLFLNVPVPFVEKTNHSSTDRFCTCAVNCLFFSTDLRLLFYSSNTLHDCSSFMLTLTSGIPSSPNLFLLKIEYSSSFPFPNKF